MQNVSKVIDWVHCLRDTYHTSTYCYLYAMFEEWGSYINSQFAYRVMFLILRSTIYICCLFACVVSFDYVATSAYMFLGI